MSAQILRAILASASLAIALAWAATPARAQDDAVPKSSSSGTPVTAPVAVAPGPAAPLPIATQALPVPEIAGGAERLAARLRDLDASLATRETLEALDASLAEQQARADALIAETARLFDAGARIALLDRISSSLVATRDGLRQQSESVTLLAQQIEKTRDELDGERAIWAETLKQARASGAPDATIQTIEATIGAIRGARDVLKGRRARVLTLADSFARAQASLDQQIGRVDEVRNEAAGGLLRRDGRALWRLDFGTDAREQMRNDAIGFYREEWRAGDVRREEALPRAALQVLLIALLAFAFRGARADARRRTERDPAFESASAVFHEPLSAALLLGLLAMPVFHPRLGPTSLALASLLGIVPAVRILRRFVGRPLRPVIHLLAGFFAIDTVRELMVPTPEIEQIILALETGLLIVFLLPTWRRIRHEIAPLPPELSVRKRTIEWSTLGLLAATTVAFLGTLTGFMQLARLLAGGALSTLYVGAALYAGAYALDGLLIHALRVRPLVLLHLATRHREAIERGASRWSGRLAALAFVVLTLRNFRLDGVAFALLGRVLAFELLPGEFELSIGDLATFVLAVWIAVHAARLLRIVLDEDVYPRVSLGRGVPYAISSLTQYAIVIAGFLAGVSVIGFDLSRVTILAGALGVGIGFGLQNIVNNFVSGLILLFERPIQIGDLVRLADLQGEVLRIGIRASTIRTYDGAEVIVPNAHLIQERVTNWTLSDRVRRVEIAVGASYETDPDRAIEVLLGVARAQPLVLLHPAPMALFRGFGESSLDFVLRCWIAMEGDWVKVRSDLGIAVHRALREAGIEIPFPQRELHLCGPAVPGANVRGGGEERGA